MGEELLKRIGVNITRFRKAKGLTLKELGLRCGMDKSDLIHIEKGRTNVTIKTLCRISQQLEINVRDLF